MGIIYLVYSGKAGSWEILLLLLLLLLCCSLLLLKPVLLNDSHLILNENTMALLLLLLVIEGYILEVASCAAKILIHGSGQVLLLCLIVLVAQLLELIFGKLVAEDQR